MANPKRFVHSSTHPVTGEASSSINLGCIVEKSVRVNTTCMAHIVASATLAQAASSSAKMPGPEKQHRITPCYMLLW